MSNLVYSTNGEEFNYDFEEAVERAFDEFDVKVGDTITIYSGEKVQKKASDFVTYISEAMSEGAYEELPEWCDTWPDSTKEQDSELEAAMRKLVDEWADKHNLQPTFYGVTNTRELNLILTSDDGDFKATNQEDD